MLVNQVEAVMVSFITTFCLHVWHARKHRQTNTKISCGCAMIVKVHWEINTFVPAFVSLFPFENLFWLVNLISKLFIWCPLMFLFDNRTVDFRPGEKRNNSQQNCTSQSFKKNTFFYFVSVFASASTTAMQLSQTLIMWISEKWKDHRQNILESVLGPFFVHFFFQCPAIPFLKSNIPNSVSWSASLP